MKRIILIVTILISGGCLRIAAQFDTQLSNYWAAQNYYNPASIGMTGKLELMALDRMQWLGIENAPKTILVTANMPLKFLGRTHGVGVMMVSEDIGLFKHMVLAGQYAYKTKLFKNDLSIGVQFAKIDQTFFGSKVIIDPPEGGESQEPDPDIPTTDVKSSSFDFGFGIFYSTKKWHVGLSASHLLEPTLTSSEGQSSAGNFFVARAYYLTGGYNIQFDNPLLELRPSALLKLTSNIFQVDMNARLIYKKMFWGGLGWRYNDAAIVMLGAQIKSFQLGYAYDFPISKIIKGTTGSHELFLKYSIDLNLNKGNKNKHKSVRIL